MGPAVDIILDGKKFAFRNWTIIPRVGDHVLLKNGEISALVESVIWGDDSACRHTERQWIQLVCKTAESIVENGGAAQ